MPDWTAGLDRDGIEQKVYADTLENMGIDSSAELDIEQHSIVQGYVDMLIEAQSGEWANGLVAGEDRDISWDGPLAQWLDMMDIRPMVFGVDVGMSGED